MSVSCRQRSVYVGNSKKPDCFILLLKLWSWHHILRAAWCPSGSAEGSGGHVKNSTCIFVLWWAPLHLKPFFSLPGGEGGGGGGGSNLLLITHHMEPLYCCGASPGSGLVFQHLRSCWSCFLSWQIGNKPQHVWSLCNILRFVLMSAVQPVVFALKHDTLWSEVKVHRDFILMRKWALSPICFENDWIPTEDVVPLRYNVRSIRTLFFFTVYRRICHSCHSWGLVLS